MVLFSDSFKIYISFLFATRLACKYECLRVYMVTVISHWNLMLYSNIVSRSLFDVAQKKRTLDNSSYEQKAEFIWSSQYVP